MKKGVPFCIANSYYLRYNERKEVMSAGGVAALMLFLMAVRTIKFDFLPSGDAIFPFTDASTEWFYSY